MILPQRKRSARVFENDAEAAADITIVTPDAKPQRKRKLPEDIGIAGLLLGAGTVAQQPPAAPQIAEAAAQALLAPLPYTSVDEQILTAATLRLACDHLTTADQRLAPLIAQHGPPERLIVKGDGAFATLCKTIVFQQLATTAAAKIFARVLDSCACTPELLTPAAIIATPLETLRQAGLSQRKAEYLHDLARHFNDGLLSDELLRAMDMAALHSALTSVKGLGPWSVDMFALFHLGKPNCLPTGDLGVRRGMKILYGLKNLPSPAEMERIASAWHPWRSVGSYYMWRVVEVSKK
jgi:DNA-3-methyladenine glycosylase II